MLQSTAAAKHLGTVSAVCLQYSFSVNWENWGGEAGTREVVPTLEAIPLRPGGIPTAILAAGAFTAAIVSEHGNTLDSFGLPVHPAFLLSWACI